MGVWENLKGIARIAKLVNEFFSYVKKTIDKVI